MGSRRIAALVAGLVLAVVPVAAAQRSRRPAAAESSGREARLRRLRSGRRRQGRQRPRRHRDPDQLPGERPPQDHRPRALPTDATRRNWSASSPTTPTTSPSSTSPSWRRTSWAGAGFEIKGQADADGKTPADDVSGFKKITFQLYAKGVESVRVEAISRGHGVDLQAGYPQMSFKVRPGLNTYEVALKALAQPRWVDFKIEPKKILQKLTALNITAYLRAVPAERGHAASSTTSRSRNSAAGRRRRGQRPLLS